MGLGSILYSSRRLSSSGLSLLIGFQVLSVSEVQLRFRTAQQRLPSGRSFFLSAGRCLYSLGSPCRAELIELLISSLYSQWKVRKDNGFSCRGDWVRMICFHVSGVQSRKVKEKGCGCFTQTKGRLRPALG